MWVASAPALGESGDTLESSLETEDDGEVGGDRWLPLTKLLDDVDELELELLPDSGNKFSIRLFNFFYVKNNLILLIFILLLFSSFCIQYRHSIFGYCLLFYLIF